MEDTRSRIIRVGVRVLIRAIFMVLLLAALALPYSAYAGHYRVRAGDSLALIAQRYHTSIRRLASVNRIVDANLVQLGRVLWVPSRYGRSRARIRYHVRWGDTLSGVAAHYGVSIDSIRALNPSLGGYLLTGQWLTIYGSSPATYTSNGYSMSSGASARYTVRVGDTLSGIAAAYGVSQASIIAANRIQNPHIVVLGASLVVPGGASATASAGVYDPWTARSLIAQYAYRFGLSPALPLAVGWQESGFNQTVVSSTGAIGVMQVEPYTGVHISSLLGLRLNLHNIDDNVHAGVYWLSALVRYYGGDERMAIAAYYQGSKSLARRGMYQDTVQYVASVTALTSRFGG